MENSKIEWTDHTLNFWHGCLKVSPGCTNCYAETLSNRWGRNIWGPPQTTERYRTKGPWADCLKWDKQAEADGKRARAFCQSMSDFFEDHPQLATWRQEAFKIIEGFEWLDVQLLTKRPENVLGMVPASWLKNWPPHVWIGTSIENQEYADKRIPELLKIPAAIRFLSCEPLLGPIDLSGRTMETVWVDAEYADLDYSLGEIVEEEGWPIHWVIVGGESGHNARPMHPDWARSIRDQCISADVAFFMKQWGEFIPADSTDNPNRWTLVCAKCGKSGDYPLCNCQPFEAYHQRMEKVGKKAAGRLLDGQEWSQFPIIEKIPQLSPVF